MQSVSGDFMARVRNDSRETTVMVKLYLDGEEAAPITLLDDDVVDVRILEETGAESHQPLGIVTSNTCDITLDNTTRKFSPLNQTSPYFGKLQSKIKVEVFLGLRMAPLPGGGEGIFEFVKAGTFRTSGWDESADGVEAFTTCVDKLYWLGKTPVPDLGLHREIELADLFVLLFEAMGLSSSEYYIDPNINVPIGVAWLPEGNFIDVLQSLAMAGNCVIYVDRDEKLQVRNNLTTSVVDTFTDNDMIFSLSNPQSALTLHTGVQVNYHIPTVVSDANVLQISEISIGQGETLEFPSLSFNFSPVIALSRMKLSGDAGVTVQVYDLTTRSCSLRMTNNGNPCVVDLTLYGSYYNMAKANIIQYDPAAQADRGDNLYVVDSPLIQDAETATNLATQLLPIVTDPFSRYTVETRHNQALEIMDSLNIEAPSMGIPSAQVIILRQNVLYDGALSSTLEARGRRLTP